MRFLLFPTFSWRCLTLIQQYKQPHSQQHIYGQNEWTQKYWCPPPSPSPPSPHTHTHTIQYSKPFEHKNYDRRNERLTISNLNARKHFSYVSKSKEVKDVRFAPKQKKKSRPQVENKNRAPAEKKMDGRNGFSFRTRRTSLSFRLGSGLLGATYHILWTTY